MILLFNVVEQTVTRTDTVTGLVNESVDYLDLSFTFKSNSVWDNLDKKIEFYSKGTGVYDLELENDSVLVPFEVLTGDYFIFSLYGTDGDLRVTTNKMKVYLKESGFIGDGVAPSDDKRTIIEKINDRIDTVVVDVDALESTVSGHTSSLSTLSDDVTALDNAVDSLSDTVSGHTTSIGGLTDDLSALDGTVDDLSDTVSDLNGTVSGHTSSIGTIENDITSINGKLTNTIEMTVTFTDETTATYNVVVREDESN